MMRTEQEIRKKIRELSSRAYETDDDELIGIGMNRALWWVIDEDFNIDKEEVE